MVNDNDDDDNHCDVCDANDDDDDDDNVLDANILTIIMLVFDYGDASPISDEDDDDADCRPIKGKMCLLLDVQWKERGDREDDWHWWSPTKYLQNINKGRPQILFLVKVGYLAQQGVTIPNPKFLLKFTKALKRA